MNILFSTHHLFTYSGTETYAITLIKSLTKRKHNVTVYSKYLNINKYEFLKSKRLKFVNDLEKIKHIKFDIIHAQHNVNTIELRYFFPHTPMVVVYHGIKPALEQPVTKELNITTHIAVSQEIKDYLIKQGIPCHKIIICPNMFDTKLFYSINPLHLQPQKALIFSSYTKKITEKRITKACQHLNISVDLFRTKYGQIKYTKINQILNRYDLIFTVGRGAIESILAGRLVIVISDIYLGRKIKPDNFDKIKTNNFSGRHYKSKPFVKTIIREIKKYNPQDIRQLQNKAIREYSTEIVVPKLEKVYQNSIKNFQNLPFDSKYIKLMYSLIQSTRQYENITHEEERQELNQIRHSKLFKLWPIYNRIKNLIKNEN